MPALEACAGDLASGVPAHLTQRTSEGILAAASPASCVGGLIGRGVRTTCVTGACFLTRTQPGALARALPCAPNSAGKEGRCDTSSAGGAGAPPGVPQGLPEG